MKTKPLFLAFVLFAILMALPTPSSARPRANASQYGGNFGGWPASWTAIDALNDPHDPGLTGNAERVDFVGDAAHPGAYYAGNADYLFFRVRMDDGAATEFSDTILILIDQDRDGQPDYSFQWDSQSMDQTQHGLELGVLRRTGPTWADVRMDDIDGDNGKKFAPRDFGTGNGDGYIRILNGQATTNFGTTTFVDFAVKWNYLYTETALRKGQTWNIQLGSISNANDHNFFDEVAGGLARTSVRTFSGAASFGSTAIHLQALQAAQRPNGSLPGITGAVLLVGVSLAASRLRARRFPSR